MFRPGDLPGKSDGRGLLPHRQHRGPGGGGPAAPAGLHQAGPGGDGSPRPRHHQAVDAYAVLTRLWQNRWLPHWCILTVDCLY